MAAGLGTFHGAPRGSPWSPKTIPTYAPGRCSTSARKLQGFGGSSAAESDRPAFAADAHDGLLNVRRERVPGLTA